MKLIFFSACRLGIQLYIYLIPDIHMSVVRHTWAYQMLFLIFDCSVKIELSYVADFGKWVDIHRSYKLIQSFLVISFNESDFFLSSSPIILSVNQISWFFNTSPEWLLTSIFAQKFNTTEYVLFTVVFGIYWGFSLKLSLLIRVFTLRPEQALSGAWRDYHSVLLLYLNSLQKYLKIIIKILIIYAKFQFFLTTASTARAVVNWNQPKIYPLCQWRNQFWKLLLM